MAIIRSLAQEIRIGSQSNPTYRWDRSKIVLGSTRGVFTVDVLGNELSVDEFSATVRWNVDAPLVYNPAGTPEAYKTNGGGIYVLKKPANYGQKFLTDIPPSTAVYWYVGGSVFAKGYLKSVERVGRQLYKITCMSGVGLLDAKTHVGGLYNGQTMQAILQSIVGSTFTYSVNSDVAAVTVYGHLPYDTARKNLHRLLFATGAVLMRRADGNYNFEFLSNTLTNVPMSRTALSGKTEYVPPADSVEVTEHSFFALNSDEVVSLFDNSNGAAVSDQLVLFDNPMHDLSTTGNLTISAASVNHAVVSGVGSLSGKKYTHNALIMKTGTGSNNVKRVTSNELVSFANSYYVMQRVYSYYTSTKKLESKILLDGEKPGMLLSLRDAFKDATNAYLSQMDVGVTTVKLANCKLVAGFQPGANGNNFTRRTIIPADATWTVPSGVTRIRIVLIGGGQGGQGGYDGADGLDETTTPHIQSHTEATGLTTYGFSDGYTLLSYENGVQPPGVGGAAGSAGAKAAFLVSDVSIAAGASISVVVGQGGAGGARNGEEGSAGTPTTAQSSAFGTLSSNDGIATYEGYNDPISGLTFAVDGVDGVKGGDGGMSPQYGWNNESGSRGENALTWSGGAGGAGIGGPVAPDYPELAQYQAGGGGGGGAANGRNGGAGTAAILTQEQMWDRTHTMSWYRKVYQGGSGGNGADAIAPNQPSIYGQGGAGGHGGGGGGNAAGSYYICFQSYGYDIRYEVIKAGTKGTGGQGSAGSKGGNGCAIIYY